MESWHNTKFAKYSSLVNIIHSNGWTTDLFLIEVGARGYCSNTVPHALKRIGFTNRLAYKTSKTLAEIARKASFCIWLARNSKEWKPDEDLLKLPHIPKVLHKKACVGVPLQVKGSQKTCQNLPSTSSKEVPLQSSLSQHAGFVNKGNTCYVNAILQALSVLPNFWLPVSLRNI